MGVFEAMVDLMGGLELFEGPVKRDADLERVVATGVPAEVVRHLAESTGMSLGELQEIALIEKSTLNRRIRQQALLKVYESDRIARVARVAALAMEA
jgi:putative toxin-antitoxin system antitoxin component (TIGR02293 family)